MGRLSLFLILVVGCVSVKTSTRNLGYRFGGIARLPRPVTIEAGPFRLETGDKVEAIVRGGTGTLSVRLMRPLCVAERLMPLQGQIITFSVDPEDPKGLYVLTAVIRTKKGQESVAKRTFLTGPITADLFKPPSAPNIDPRIHIPLYLQSLQSLGGNLVIFHPPIGSDRPYYESGLTTKRVIPQMDVLGTLLKECSKRGIAVLVGITWDTTTYLSHKEKLASLYKIATELYFLYGAYPSFAGFYLGQDGGEKSYVELVRRVGSYIKSNLNGGLLFACSGYVNDPLLSGYLAQVEEVDLIIAEGGVVRSWEPEIMVCHPVRRLADFVRIFATAAKTCGKTVLGSVNISVPETISKSRICPPMLLRDQILALAASTPLDGILFRSYHADVVCRGDEPSSEAAKEVLQEALPAFRLIQSVVPEPPVALFYPNTRWRNEHLTTTLYRAADGLRCLGIAFTIAVSIPPPRESLTFLPTTHPNKAQIAYLHRHHPVLLLVSLPALNDPDAELVLDFVSGGGVVSLFGTPFPATTKRFAFSAITGVKRDQQTECQKLTVKSRFGFIKEGVEFKFKGKVRALLHERGSVLVRVDDEHVLSQAVKFGEGFVFTTPIAPWEQSSLLAYITANTLLESVFTAGKSHVFFEQMLPQESQVICGEKDGEMVVCVVNHTGEEITLSMRLPKEMWKGAVASVLGADGSVKKVRLKGSGAKAGVRFNVPAHWFALITFKEKAE